MLCVSICKKREKCEDLMVTSPAELQVDGCNVAQWLVGPSHHPKAGASTRCGCPPGWQWQCQRGHITPLKPLLTPSFLQSGASREKEANLLEFFPNSVRAPAAEAKLNSPMYLLPQPVFLAGFGNYTHREANEIWRRPLSLTVTTAAEIGWGTLLFFSLAARHTQHYAGASALHGHAKKATGLLR